MFGFNKIDFQRRILEVESLGSITPKATSLAGLHEARKAHLSQFFTPLSVVNWIYRALNASFSDSVGTGRIRLFDNSVGSGRMFYYADPEAFSLYGLDVHQDSISALMEASQEAGFEGEFINAGIESVRLGSFSCAIINPPFSITLESPHINPEYQASTFGKFGPNTRCLSHVYALAQALFHCQSVAAVLPESMIQVIEENEHFRSSCVAVAKLPALAFASENANVRTIVAFFDRNHTGTYRVFGVDNLESEIPDVRLTIQRESLLRAPILRSCGIDPSIPTIPEVVTGNRCVRVCHNGRKIVLKFDCGLTKAKVLNKILVDQVPNDPKTKHRYPKGVLFLGQGKLDIESHLASGNAIDSFNRLIAEIEEAGGTPCVDQGLIQYLAKRERQHMIEVTPLRHVVYETPNSTAASSTHFSGTAACDQTATDAWGSPFIEKGTEVQFSEVSEGNYTFMLQGIDTLFPISAEAIQERFVLNNTSNEGMFIVKHPGLCATFPKLAFQIQSEIKAAGVDQWVSWDYQLHDLTELLIKPKGAICAWEMGLGKARLALAVAFMRGNHNLICVEPHLIDEMRHEIQELNIPGECIQFISAPEDCKRLRKINIISYNLLKSKVKNKGYTYSKLLRHRICTFIGDEGHLLRHTKTKQTRAVFQLSPKNRFILTGTPIANYPRDILPLLQFVGGDGTAAQKYGLHHPYCRAGNAESMAWVPRGIDRFSDQHICFEWVTNEFSEELQEGSKREVPYINNVADFRKSIAPWIKRRVAAEPDVAKEFNIPTPKTVIHTIDWDLKHLEFYIRSSRHFVQWFMDDANSDNKKKSLSLMSAMLKIGAVRRAANIPSEPMKGSKEAYTHITSKERFLCNRVQQLANDGHKIILYSAFPAALDRMIHLMEEQGLEGVRFHGGVPISKRTKALNNEFRWGAKPALFASFECGQTGLNIPQADRVLCMDRMWSSKSERQALARVLRPQQKNQPQFEFCHYSGSIDEYMAQMVDFKAAAADSGLDWGCQPKAASEFMHVDTILEKFCIELESKMDTELNKIFNLAV